MSLFGQLKLLWEFGMIYAAGFWMGILWRRTNRKAVWSSILISLLLFFVLPFILPAFFSNLRYNEKLLLQTDPQTVTRTYTATIADVEMREQDILSWDALSEVGRAKGPRPESLIEGEKFEKDYKLPRKAIFWTKGISIDENGNSYGSGLLSLELVFYEALGFDLQNNSYSLNETIRVLTRTIVPFLIIILVSFLYTHTREERKVLDRFYVKMKTPVKEDKVEDKKEMEESYRNPHRFDHLLLFPKTHWQFTRWDRTDAWGFFFSVLMVIGILLFLYFSVNLGGKIDF